MNIETRKARSTKTTVERTDREIVCVDHGGIVELESIKQAREFMSCPQDWCMDCQENFYHFTSN